MVKRIIVIAALLCTTLLAADPVYGQAGIEAQVPDADYSFGQHITFYLQARSSDPITEVNLFFRVQGQADITAVPVSLEPATEISIHHPYSLVGENLPPFTLITYWWEVHNGSGARAKSEEKLLYYADNRYDWQFVQHDQDGVRWSAYWVTGDVVFGQTALNAAIKALQDIERELNVAPPPDIRIYIYPSEEDLRSALNLAGYDWAGGQARPELGAVLVGIPNDLSAPREMERLIPHELTHLLVYEKVGRLQDRVPPWLNEGLASLNERRPDPNRRTLVKQALTEDRLIPLEALCAPFSQEAYTARLAYAQSASVVRYLREQYGSQAIRDLLAAYADDASCDAGVQRVLGKSLKGLESAWRADLTGQGQALLALQDSGVWLAFWIMTILVVLPLLGILRRGEPGTEHE